MGTSITSQTPIIALYDVAHLENMSPTLDDDVPPPGYDLVCKEHMEQGPQYETVESAKAGASTVVAEKNTVLVASLEPPPLPPPMIRAESDSPSLPPSYDPAVSMEQGPQYDTVESVVAAATSTVAATTAMTSLAPPPPVMRAESESPSLPPPYDPAVDESGNELSIESCVATVPEKIDESVVVPIENINHDSFQSLEDIPVGIAILVDRDVDTSEMVHESIEAVSSGEGNIAESVLIESAALIATQENKIAAQVLHVYLPACYTHLLTYFTSGVVIAIS